MTAPLHKEKSGYWLLLILLVATAYFPVFVHLFSLKNDALVYFLPLRHQVSNAIREGHFAWWSDAIYLGTPLYSDIQSGAWNPLVLLLSLFGKYNMSMLETELSIYLLAAALGMYKLAGRFSNTTIIRLVIALSYTCSGFMTDSGSFIPWINAAALLPFIFYYFIRLLETPGLRSTIPFTLFVFLLLTSGYPSFLVYSGYVMAGILIYLFFCYRKKWTVIRPVLLHLLLFLFLSILLWSPVIYAWMDYFPYYQRGSAVPLSFAQINPFPTEGLLSLLVPSALTPGNDWLNTDQSMRNISTGLFTFLFLPLSFSSILKSRILKIITILTVISLLISLGGVLPLHQWCYRFLPMFDRFRHPGTLRLFAILGMLLIAAIAFDRLYKNDPETTHIARLIAWIALISIMCITGYGFIQTRIWQEGFLSGGMSALSKLQFPDLLLLQGAVQLVFLGCFLFLNYRKRNRWLPALIVAQVITACWIALPLTFISKTPARLIDQEIATLSSQQTSQTATVLMKHTDRRLGPEAPVVIVPAFYDNTPVFNHDIISPTVSTSYLRFLNDSIKCRIAAGLPWAFFSANERLAGSSADSSSQTESTKVSAELLPEKSGALLLRLHTTQPGYLYLFRQYHHRWKAHVNGEKREIHQADNSFMAIPVKSGPNTVELTYDPGRTQLLLSYICLFVFSGLVVAMLSIIIWPKKQISSALEKHSVS